MSTLTYFTMLRYIINCGLRIAFGTTTHSDRERSRVGLQLCEVKMRLTTFLDVVKRLISLYFNISSIISNKPQIGVTKR